MRLLTSLFAILLLAGCSIPKIPQNAAEVRSQVGEGMPGSRLTKKTTQIDRRYLTVRKAVANKFDECFSAVITYSGQRSAGQTRITPKKRLGKTSSEFTLQSSFGGFSPFGKEPKDGFFDAVFDIYPSGSGTAIDSYRWRGAIQSESSISGKAEKAIIGWAKGTVRGCPDLAK